MNIRVLGAVLLLGCGTSALDIPEGSLALDGAAVGLGDGGTPTDGGTPSDGGAGTRVHVIVHGGGVVCAAEDRCVRDQGELEVSPGTLLTARPDDGWSFETWAGDCAGVDVCEAGLHEQIVVARLRWTEAFTRTIPFGVHDLAAYQGGVLLVGRFQLPDRDERVTIAHVTSTGTVMWSRDLGYMARAVAVSEGGDIVLGGELDRRGGVVGGVEIESRGGSDGLLTRMRGDEAHTQRIGGEYSDHCGAVTFDGERALATCSFGSRLIVARDDGAGRWTTRDLGWASRTSRGVLDAGAAIEVGASGDIFLAVSVTRGLTLEGVDLAVRGSGDGLVLRLSPALDVVWGRTYGGDGRSVTTERNDTINDLTIDPETGDLFVAGTIAGEADVGGTSLTTAHRTNAFLARLSPSDGATRWARTFGTHATSSGQRVSFVDGRLHFGGRSEADEFFETPGRPIRFCGAHGFLLELDPVDGQLEDAHALPAAPQFVNDGTFFYMRLGRVPMVSEGGETEVRDYLARYPLP